MCALAIVVCALFGPLSDGPADEFAPPIRLEAGGRPIDRGAFGGCAAPTLHDVDGDGLADLVVGDASGRFSAYRNDGTRDAPRFGEGRELVSTGITLLPIGMRTRSNPRFADFDGDGIVDLTSGSLECGSFWLHRGGDVGCFEEAREITTLAELPKLRTPQELLGVESSGSCVELVDWDDDGDLDLLSGRSVEQVALFQNVGTRATPSYSPTPTALVVDDAPLRVPGGIASLVAADWDGDGLVDLACGGANGGVVWFRNVGAHGRPHLTRPQALVAPPANADRVWLGTGDALHPGSCAQIDVVDWDHDGRLDLLLGDFETTVTPRDDFPRDQIGDVQRRALASLREQYESADAERRRLDGMVERKRDELHRDPRLLDAAARARELWSELECFLVHPAGDDVRRGVESLHGSVWLYVRK